MSQTKLFNLGKLVATPGAMDAFSAFQPLAGEMMKTYLEKHQSGDWSEMEAYDVRENHFSAINDLRILSAYTLPSGQKIWIITEADRSVTTLLLPEEY